MSKIKLLIIALDLFPLAQPCVPQPSGGYLTVSVIDVSKSH